MLLAAADPTGDATLLWRAAQTLGLGRDAAAAADAEQLLQIGSQVRFRHPLVRSAAYAAGSPEDRRAAHLTLAAATDAQDDPERRVWHLAAAATGPDEDVAAALEQAAVKTQARAGLAAAAAFLQRSVTLTAEPGRRADRALAAALANLHAGAFDTALGLLAQAEADAVDDLQRARVEQLRGQVEWASVAGREAPVLLLQAAKRLESLHVGLARETYLYAWVASTVAGPLAGPGGLLLEVSRAARAAPPPAGAPRPCDLLLDGLATMVTQGHAAAEPTLRRAVDAFLGDQVSGEEWLQWGILAQMATMAVWDFDGWVRMSTRHVELARASGALAPLSIALNGRGQVATQCGDFETATSLAAEKDVVNEVTGIRLASTCDLLLAGYRGRPAEAIPLFSATTEDSIARGEGGAVQLASWADGGPPQWSRALRRGIGCGATRDRGNLPALGHAVGSARTDRGRRENRAGGTGPGSAGAAVGHDGHRGFRLGEGPGGALASAAERRRRMPSTATPRRSSGSAAPSCGPSSPGPTCSTASGFVASSGGATHATSCAPPTTCSPRSALRPSPSVPAASCSPPARRSASARSTPRHRAHPAGGAHRPAGPGRTHQPRDRRGTVHQRPHRGMAPPQGVHQTGHHLPQGPPRRLAPARSAHAIRLSPSVISTSEHRLAEPTGLGGPGDPTRVFPGMAHRLRS